MQLLTGDPNADKAFFPINWILEAFNWLFRAYNMLATVTLIVAAVSLILVLIVTWCFRKL